MSRRSGGVAADSGAVADAVADAVATLEAALRVAFGPGGRGVMLKEGSTGTLCVSRSSREIARASFDGAVPPPWLVPVLSAAEALQRRAGDGGKGLLLGALAVARLGLSPTQVRDVLAFTDRLATSGLSAPTGKLEASNVESVVRTFLGTRLAPAVLDALLPSVCQWLNQDHDFASKHAKSLCRVEETLGPVSAVCGQGVTLLCRAENVPKVAQRMKVVVALEGCVPAEADLVGTVIVSKCLEEKVVCRVVAGGAALLYGLSAEDERLVSEAEGALAEVKWVKGGVWMSIPGVRQLVVQGPVASLGREIARSARDALALVRFADERVVRVGAVERCLLRRLMQGRGKPPPLGRELLLALTSTTDEGCADDVAAAILDLVATSPEMKTVLGVAVSPMTARIPTGSGAGSGADADVCGLEPVLLRLAVLSGALAAGSCTNTASAPLPARRLHS